MIPTVISLFHPHPASLSLVLDESTTVDSLRADVLAQYVPVARQKLLLASGRPLGLWSGGSTLAQVLADEDARRGDKTAVAAAPTLFLQLGVRMCGGKGGFGSQLRAAGGRMSSSKKSNRNRQKTQDEKDSEVGLCRDLSGRRIKTIVEARQLVTHLQNAEERERVKEEARLKKLDEALKVVEAHEAARGSKNGQGEDAVPPQKDRFADRQFLKEKAKMTQGVKSAVARALAKQRLDKTKTSMAANADAIKA